ncbi:MAG: DUF1990 family protein [Isosphaeraceae bacterium]
MVSLRRPTTEMVLAFLRAQAQRGFSYPEVGATAGELPHGYVVDRTRVALGRGEDHFHRAREALGRWDQFRLGWVDVWPPGTPIAKDQVVAIVARTLGLWWLSACQIVDVVDESGPIHRYGFAYGTLPDHAGSGEERFLVEWDRQTGEVWYEILAFSRPRWLVSRLGYGYMRHLQKRFGAESAAAMVRAVGVEGPKPILNEETTT